MSTLVYVEQTWDVYVSQSSSKNKEKGVIPSSSIIEAFLSLSPSPDKVKVYPANWKRQSKSKGKGHTVRCIQRKQTNEIISAFEVTNVDSVDKVYHIITHHMKLDNINPKACECLTCYFAGNERLEDGTPSQAITLYNRALSTARENTKDRLPQGSILMKRSRAYLKRAANHRKLLQLLVKDLADAIPDATTLRILYQTSSANSSLAPAIFARLAADSKGHQVKFRSIRYRHDMYEFALLHAARDSLQATQLLPTNSNAWSLAGECLAKLRKLKESTQYYQKAVELDPGLEGKLKDVMDRNIASMEFMEVARGGGFSADTLRLALDVAD
jgi:tetratricopeptide (TPR) repeat protein